MLGQVQPEGGTPGMRWTASELVLQLAGSGAEKASHANCAVVSQRTLAAAVAWWWRCMGEWKKGQKPQWRNDCARIRIMLPRGLPLVLCYN